MALLIRKIPDQTYGKSIYFVKGTWKQIEAWWPKEFGEMDLPAYTKGFFHYCAEYARPRHFVVINTTAPETSKMDQLATLAHEVLHLAFRVLGDSGVKYCDASEEAFTYWFDSIFSRMVRAAKLL